MPRDIRITLGGGLGATLGPTFNLTANVGTVTPATATKSQLLSGYYVVVNDAASTVTITSVGECTNSISAGIPCSTTTSTSTSTTSTTTEPTTTTSTSTTTEPTTTTSTSTTSTTTEPTTTTSTTSTSTSTTTTTTFSPDPCNCVEVVITSAGGEVATFNCFGTNENYVYMNAGTYHICAAVIGGLLQAEIVSGTGTLSPVGNCKTQTCPPPTTTTSTSTTSTSTSTTTEPTTTTSTSTTSTTTEPTTTTTTTTVAPSCLCYSYTDFPSNVPANLNVRYRSCSTNTITTTPIDQLEARDNLDGTYTWYICVLQGSSYSIPTCVVSGIEQTCPQAWIEGGSCVFNGDCDVVPTTTTTTTAATTTTTTATPTTTTTTTGGTTTTTTTTPPISAISVFGYMEPCIGGTIDDFMGAQVNLNGNVSVDTEFEVQVTYTALNASCSSGTSTTFFYITIPAGQGGSNFNACNNGQYFPSGATICGACINTCDNPAVDISAVDC
jgi:hypothetical protein